MKIDDNQLQTLIDICNIYLIPINLINNLLNHKQISDITVKGYNYILYLIKIQKGGFLDD